MNYIYSLDLFIPLQSIAAIRLYFTIKRKIPWVAVTIITFLIFAEYFSPPELFLLKSGHEIFVRTLPLEAAEIAIITFLISELYIIEKNTRRRKKNLPIL